MWKALRAGRHGPRAPPERGLRPRFGWPAPSSRPERTRDCLPAVHQLAVLLTSHRGHWDCTRLLWAPLVAQTVKSLPAMPEA